MNVLGMFSRRPTPGKTKTRLAATIGNDAAARLHAAFIEDLIHRYSNVSEQFLVAATPDDQATSQWFNTRLATPDQLMFQPEGSLGDRIEWYFRTTVRHEADRSVLIGSDSPDLPTAIIESAFAELQTADVVISPASDGGFVLIGLSVPPANLFHNIAWSSASTLLDTLQAARRNNMTIKLLQAWYDIDTVENLGTLLALQQTDESAAAVCPRTAAILKELWPEIRS